jgi:hypothetical protein
MAVRCPEAAAKASLGVPIPCMNRWEANMLKPSMLVRYTEALSVAGAGLALALAAPAAEAAAIQPAAPGQGGIVQLAQDYYVDGYNRHRHHHGHVHGNPYRRHLDCNWHGDHEHCQVHAPRRRHYHRHHHHYDDDGYRYYRRHRHDSW